MPKTKEKPVHVLQRLKLDLNESDRHAWQRAMVDLLVNSSSASDVIEGNDKWINLFVPDLCEYSNDWKGIKSMKDIKGSFIANKARQFIRNQKGRPKIDSMITAQKLLEAQVTEDEEYEDEADHQEMAANQDEVAHEKGRDIKSTDKIHDVDFIAAAG